MNATHPYGVQFLASMVVHFPRCRERGLRLVAVVIAQYQRETAGEVH